MRMAVACHRSNSRTKLKKRLVATYEGWNFCTVDSSCVRNIAEPDEEFGNFATQDEFPDLIPKGEIWLEEKNLDKEGVFFIANALARFKQREDGSSEEAA
jgi:hypothetical protein